MAIKVNRFTLSISPNGYPVWITLQQDNNWEKEIRFGHNELRDLGYSVKMAIREAQLALPRQYKKEV